MTHFRIPAFLTLWFDHMFRQFSARRIVRERYFKRWEKAERVPRMALDAREKTVEKKDTIRRIRRIRITASVN